jgi:NitT/TauT family transport system ATP-binding protein
MNASTSIHRGGLENSKCMQGATIGTRGSISLQHQAADENRRVTAPAGEIRIDGVTKIFSSAYDDDVLALDNVSVKIGDKEFVSIVGPSGCGKSTLLRLIAGLIQPSEGRILIGGSQVTRPRPETGIVFQQPTLMPWRNVTENIRFPLQIMGRNSEISGRKAMELIGLVGLKGFENRHPGELSGGMQQRVSICRALIHDPAILLMDEPFGALDAMTRDDMATELLRIWTERPMTVVFITHSIAEAVLLSDHVVVMSRRPGRVLEIVDVSISRPRTLRSSGSSDFQSCVQRIRDLIAADKRSTSGTLHAAATPMV